MSINHGNHHSPGPLHRKMIPVSSVSSFYELSAPLLNGKMEQFSRHEGKVTLVVNMASCDKNTKQELLQLNELVTLYGPRGLVVMVFPCNQLGKLEPLENDEIPVFLQCVRPGAKFEPKFILFSITEINGQRCSPVYEYLKMKQSAPQDDDGQISRNSAHVPWSPITRSDIGWNYEKFLVSHDGQPVRRFSPKTSFDAIKSEIEYFLRRIPKSVREHLQLQH